MLEKFIFENHLGQRFDGLANGVYLNYNDLRDYSWSYDTINNRISRFYRSMRDRKLPLVIKCNSDEEAVAVKNRLHELAEADIEAKIPGKVFAGDYYTTGFITASAKSNYLINKRLCNIELTLTSDDPAWYREQTHPFVPDSGNSNFKVLSAATVNGLPGIPVDSDGNYTDSDGQRWICDEIDFGRGVYIQRVARIELNGSESWLTANTINGVNILYLQSGYPVSAADRGYCTHFQYGGDNAYAGKSGYIGTKYSATLGKDRLWVATPLSAVEFAGAIQRIYEESDPVTMLYPIAEPIETALDAQTIESYLGINTYPPRTSITNDSGAYMEIVYTSESGMQNTKSGTSVVIDDSSDEPLNGFRVYGKTIQNGIPALDAPSDVVSVGQKGSIVFKISDGEAEIKVSTMGGGTDHPYDFPYDYALSVKGQKIVCDSIGKSAFRLMIYGEATNPTVVIGGHVYAINGTISKGETLLIDSISKKITLTTAFGNKINWFDNRSRKNYIFEPIPAGQNIVSWSGTFGFDLTVIEKRSEPRWT